jgi:hypothetical protein
VCVHDCALSPVLAPTVSAPGGEADADTDTDAVAGWMRRYPDAGMRRRAQMKRTVQE